MKEKIFLAVFLMAVLLVGFPSSVANFNVFADDENDDREKDKKESKEYEKQKERAEEAREKAEEKKKELKEKYEEKIKKLEEKAKQLKEKEKEKIEKKLEKTEEKEKEKIEKELKKLEEKTKRLEEKERDDDDVEEFDSRIDVQLSSVTGSGVTICHYPPGNPTNAKTLTVGIPAAKAHMAAHGDTMGACDNIRDIDLILEELETKFAEKKAKLEEKRAELQQKFIEKAQKLIEKFEEKQAKRAEKLLEKIDRGDYYDDIIDEDETLRKFVFTFNSITPEPIGKQQDTTSFSGKITLITSSSTDTRGTAKFKVDSCNIGNEEFSYECEFGKARTTSSGPGGAKDGLVIITTLSHEEFTAGLKLFLTAEESFNLLEIGDKIEKITMHSPQSKITHQWFLGGEGSLEVTSVNSEDDT